MHVSARPISSDERTFDRSCLSLTWCQRETGTVHAVNALYEADRVQHIGAEPERRIMRERLRAV